MVIEVYLTRKLDPKQELQGVIDYSKLLNRSGERTCTQGRTDKIIYKSGSAAKIIYRQTEENIQFQSNNNRRQKLSLKNGKLKVLSSFLPAGGFDK